MRKLAYLFALLFVSANYTNCTPENIAEQVKEQACCDEESTIPPPPPPPPPGGGTGG